MAALLVAIRQAQTRLPLLTQTEKKVLLSRILKQLTMQRDEAFDGVTDERVVWLGRLIHFIEATFDDITDIDDTDLCQILGAFQGLLQALDGLPEGRADALTVH